MSDTLTPVEAYDLQVQVVEHVAGQRSSWIVLAERLHVFHNGKGWDALGLHSFNEWLGQPEISLGRAEAYAMLGAWRELVLDRDVDPRRLVAVDVSKVAVILPAVRRGEVTADEALADCESLSRSDLREKYHKDGSAGYRVCESCGQRVKVTA